MATERERWEEVRSQLVVDAVYALPPPVAQWDREGPVVPSKALDAACKRLAEHEAEIARLRQAVAFAACTIRSGEPWTETCERILVTEVRDGK